MKFKLTNSEMVSLTNVIGWIADGYLNAEETTMLDKLMQVMMQRLAIDLEIKKLMVKKVHLLNWHPERALAFWNVCNPLIDTVLSDQRMVFEQTLVRKLCNQIHKQFA